MKNFTFKAPRTGGSAALRGILTACLVLAAGCDFQPEIRDGKTGVLTLSFGDEAGRAITSGRDLPADVLASFRYEVTFSGPDGETLNHSASAGASLSLTLALGDWRIDAAAYQGQILTGTGSLAFTVAAGENRVRVPMRLQGGYFEINTPSTNRGSVTSTFSAAFAGTPVTLTAVPAAGYRLLSMSASGGVSLGGSGNSRTFTMPAADVTVSAEFEALYAINIAAMSGGTVTANFSAAPAGAQVTLTVTPLNAAAAYIDNTLKVNGSATDLAGSGTTWTFTMPAGDVEVRAEFYYGWRYVKETASGTGDGSSWGNASNDLQKMMDEAAVMEAEQGLEALVRVAAGTYKPEWDLMDLVANNTYTPGGRDSIFFLRAGVEVRGSYPAGGGDDTSRNPEARSTILSGDIGTLGDDADNTYHVVMGMMDGPLPPIEESTVLDGLTITGGNANVNGDLTSQGGGIFLGGASPALTNVTITGNKAITGGGLALFESSPVLTNGTITGNSASGSGGGGGMYNYDNSSPVLNNVTISNNTSTGNGGGMYNYDNSSPVLTDVTISNNTSTSGSGGGMYNENSSS
ncbi:MAG: hypothetical protein LBQ35_02260, partial [Spirochaetaceae bacterium]|nr:hypothetical protein [Spirochaetaceae bacterium]